MLSAFLLLFCDDEECCATWRARNASSTKNNYIAEEQNTQLPCSTLFSRPQQKQQVGCYILVVLHSNDLLFIAIVNAPSRPV